MIGVIGASGHIGNNLVRRLLERGEKVRAIIKSDRTALEDVKVDIAECDIRDQDSLYKALSGVKRVFHLAALITIGGHNEKEVIETNISGVFNVVTVCKKIGIERLVHFSSIHAFSQRPYDLTLDETRPPPDNNAPLYDRTKAKGQEIVIRSTSEGLDAVVVNPTAVIGPRDFKPSYMGEVILRLINGKMPGLVDAGFDWVDVRDVVDGAISAMEKGKSGECYLLSGHYCDLKKLASLIHRYGGHRPPRICAPLWLARIGLPLIEGVSKLTKHKLKLLTKDSLEALKSNRFVSHDKATRDLGYKPRPLEETIQDTIEWFKHHFISI